MPSSSLLELTTRFTAITTGAGAKKAMTPADAAKAGAGHLRYITRQKAVGEQVWQGAPGESVDDFHAALRERMREKASQGGKCGARVAEKGIVSLPNDWPEEARQEAIERIAKHLAPDDSDAMAVVVSHCDRPGNSHLHFLAVDGLESVSAARARRPNAKRVRRANVIRLGDRGRPKELRAELAMILSEIAARRRLKGVEWRSFQERGIIQPPTIHEGPAARAMAEKSGRTTPRLKENQRRRIIRVEDDLDDFLQPGGEFLDLSKITEITDSPARVPRPSPAGAKPINPVFQAFRERIRQWSRARYRSQSPRAR